MTSADVGGVLFFTCFFPPIVPFMVGQLVYKSKLADITDNSLARFNVLKEKYEEEKLERESANIVQRSQ